MIRRAGITSFEVLVAFTLLTGILTLSTSLLVANLRLQKSQRNYRLALDEVENQLERLTSLANDKLAAEVEVLEPSTFVRDRLPGAKLTGNIVEEEAGTRITLGLTWDETNRHLAPVRLSAWSVTQPTSDKSEEP